MSDIDFIKKQIKTLRDLHDNSNPMVSEHIKDIKKKYVITEDAEPREIERYNVPTATEKEIEDNEGLKDDVSQ